MIPEQYQKRLKQQMASRVKSFQKHIDKKKADYQGSENYYLQTIRYGNKSGSHVNCFRISDNETDEHIIEKFLKWLELRRRGHSVMIEPIFDSGLRCDILDLTDGIIFEIMKSEKDESIEKKKEVYPEMFEIQTIKVKKDEETTNIETTNIL